MRTIFRELFRHLPDEAIVVFIGLVVLLLVGLLWANARHKKRDIANQAALAAALERTPSAPSATAFIAPHAPTLRMQSLVLPPASTRGT